MADFEGDVGEGLGSDGVGWAGVSYVGVCALRGVGVGFDAAVFAGDYPHFLDAGAGVGGELASAVVVNGGVGDFD